MRAVPLTKLETADDPGILMQEIPVAEYSNLYLTGPAAKVELAYS